MIQSNNNYSVLPWYPSIEEQNHRKNYAFGNIFPLVTPMNKILPFQIVRESNAAEIVSVNLYYKDGQHFADITSQMNETGLQIVKFPLLGYDVIVYPGNLPLAINAEQGMFYAVINDGVKNWYSEIFTVVYDVSGYLKFEWNDAENAVFDSGLIVYKDPDFKNVLYLNTELGKPEYVFEEEGETRDGYFFPEKQISEKTYKCVALAPEYLCDVMRFIRMSDIVIVTDKYGRKYNVDTFLITPKWEIQGDLASVEIEFQTDTVVKKIGRGTLPLLGGDFNNDFNNDFNI